MGWALRDIAQTHLQLYNQLRRHGKEEIWRRLDQFNDTERNLILLDLADHLEKYQEVGGLLFRRQHLGGGFCPPV
jgi:hypothetical protein